MGEDDPWKTFLCSCDKILASCWRSTETSKKDAADDADLVMKNAEEVSLKDG
ncbi:hypothetical protein QJS10_CPA06g01791 [Acorus calamus]|uniref:Uncharacterized protein n=1 Tax=Acorus calamus TaxID=4465 RepID=A0AAV9EKC2_ACOCL|nr:hypothetical protein QJS10_CPA06g01791 [Acorus calamus]